MTGRVEQAGGIGWIVIAIDDARHAERARGVERRYRAAGPAHIDEHGVGASDLVGTDRPGEVEQIGAGVVHDEPFPGVVHLHDRLGRLPRHHPHGRDVDRLVGQTPTDLAAGVVVADHTEEPGDAAESNNGHGRICGHSPADHLAGPRPILAGRNRQRPNLVHAVEHRYPDAADDRAGGHSPTLPIRLPKRCSVRLTACSRK